MQDCGEHTTPMKSREQARKMLVISSAKDISWFLSRTAGVKAMPEWTGKDTRQFEHIKDSELKGGGSEDEAAEIAARTVNKRRRREGRTPNKTTQGIGNPKSPLKDRTVAELRNLAADAQIAGRSKMRKSELVSALARK
jgi:hypothetical protein